MMGTKHKSDREHKKKKRRRSRTPPARSRSRSPTERSKKRREERAESPGDTRPKGNAATSSSAGGGGDISLSIEETNKLRAQLGLKPLEGSAAAEGGSGEGGAEEKKAFVHAPARNLRDERRQEQQRERVATIREKRKVQERLGAVRGLGEESSGDEDSAANWVQRSRKVQGDKEEAKKRAKLFEDMDAEFGVSELVEAEVGPSRREKGYDSAALAGLTVEHSMSRFKEGQTVILTLKDRAILEEDREEDQGTGSVSDVLVNVNFQDDELAAKNVENRKGKPGYRPYEDPDVLDEATGELRARDILEKYDTEISGERREQFQLEAGGRYGGDHERAMARLRAQAQEQQLSLDLPEPQRLTDFMTAEEMAARTRFKKRKRRAASVRTTALTADDLLMTSEPQEDVAAPSGDHGRRAGGKTPKEELRKGWSAVDAEEEGERREVKRPEASPEVIEPMIPPPIDAAEAMMTIDFSGPQEPDEAAEELENELKKVRSLRGRQKVGARRREMLEAMLEETTAQPSESSSANAGGEAANVILHDTAEFCRTLGDLPSLGLLPGGPTVFSGKPRDGAKADAAAGEEAEAMEVEEEWRVERLRRELAERSAGGWQEVPASGEEDKDAAQPGADRLSSNLPAQSSAVLEEEPQLSSGSVISALKLAAQKGYLEREVEKTAPETKVYELRAQHFVQENVRYDDIDAKFSKRDRFGNGPISEFREKGNYTPCVKLVYVDESGRKLNQKEAFRELSHSFHGKGSGKKKTEKKIKRIKEEQLLKAMSSSDTPLGTVDKLHRKLETEGQPFVLLSGKNAHGNALTK